MSKRFLKNSIIAVFLIIMGLAFFHSVWAQDNGVDTGLSYGEATGLTAMDPRQIAVNIIKIALGFLGIVAVVLVMYSGWIWMTAGGDPEKINKAKKILIAASIGLAIILSSYTIVYFLFSSFMRSTGTEGLGDDNYGTPPDGAGSAFYITGTSPKNNAKEVVRNVVIKVIFSKVLSNSMDNNGLAGNFKVEKIANVNSSTSAETAIDPVVVAGSAYIGEGRREADFKAAADCGNELNTKNCFEAWGKYRVTVNGSSGIISVNQQSLSCAGGTCQFVFSTGAGIDTGPPSVGIQPSQMCQDNGYLKSGANTIGAWAQDDIGISSIRFYNQKQGGAENLSETVPGNNERIQYASYRYDTANMMVGNKYIFKVTGTDMADNADSDSFNTTIREPHCCNGRMDEDETGIDCGGQDCLSCVGGACNKNEPNQCSINNEGNCSDDLCQSFFCNCQTDDCICQQKPIIYWVTPVGGYCQNNHDQACIQDSDCGTGRCNSDTANAAPGNFITIGGKYFGTAPGRVYIQKSGGNWIEAQLANSASVGNPECGSSVWQDNQIVAVMPSGISGENLTVKVVSTANFDDSTADDRGPKLLFIQNNISRPGLCRLNPQTGDQGTAVTYYGIKMSGGTAYFGTIQNKLATKESSFSTEKQGSAKVPNINSGDNSTFVLKGLVFSNYLNFTKSLEDLAPAITSFEPQSGSSGQYVTIFGKNFGFSKGKSMVYLSTQDRTSQQFSSGSNSWKEANFDFPAICADSVWTNNQVIIKIPSGLGDQRYYILMKVPFNGNLTTIDSAQLGQPKFNLDSSLPLSPSLCKIQPVMGPINTEISLWGEYFDEKNSFSKARFHLNHDQSGDALTFWGPDTSVTNGLKPDKAVTTVPLNTGTGPVRLVKKSPELAGNGINFSVGECTKNDECGTGNICCGADTPEAGRCHVSEDDCYIKVPNCVYEWDFTTGGGIPCDGDTSTPTCQADSDICAQKAPGQPYCDPSTCLCRTLSCNSDSGGGICDATKCPSDYPLCVSEGNECKCTKGDSCSGYDLMQCSDIGGCPNAYGTCSPYTAVNSSVYGSCSNDCQGIGNCTASTCTYSQSINKCYQNNVSCGLPNYFTASNGKSYLKYCYQYMSEGRWTIDSSASCPDGWTSIGNGRCVENGTACSTCRQTGTSCVDDGNNDYLGLCAYDQNICPTGYACEAGKCTKKREAECECCCRKEKGNQDCCAGLTCDGKCGTDAANDQNKYGYCSGCAKAGTTQADHDRACNCEGSTGRYCDATVDVDNDGVYDGVCRDCAQLSNPNECSEHEATCCVDNARNNACRGTDGFNITGHKGLDTAYPQLAFCGYLSCNTTGTCNANVDKSGTYKEGERSTCVEQCGGRGPGESCYDQSRELCVFKCAPGYLCLGVNGCIDNDPNVGCQSKDGTCLCCCNPDNDQCGKINTNDANVQLKCYPDKKPCSGGERGLCCGCREDSNCGDPEKSGCSNDTCCRTRPHVIDEYDVAAKECADQALRRGSDEAEAYCRKYPIPYNSFNNICRNAQIRATFDQTMNIASFAEKAIVAADYGSASCPSGTKYLSLDDIKYDSFWVRSYYRVMSLVSRALRPILGGKVMAYDWDNHNLCKLPGIIGGFQKANSQTVVTFSPTQLMPGDKDVYVIILGDENLDSKAGVLSYYKIGMNGPGYDQDFNAGTAPLDPVTFNGKAYKNSKIWKFTTLSEQSANNGICKIDRVELEPYSYLFQKVENDSNENDADPNSDSFDTVKDGDKVFVADAVSSDNQIIVPVPEYSWSWTWNSDNTSVVTVNAVTGLGDDKSLVRANDKITEGWTYVKAKAAVSGQYASPGESSTGKATVYIFVCDNPWPTLNSDGTWEPWTDKSSNCSVSGASSGCMNTNNMLYYCRDAGGEGTADDLPAILNDAVVRGSSTMQNVLKEFYFLREQSPDVSNLNLRVKTIPSEGGKVSLAWNQAPNTAFYKIYYGNSPSIYDKSVTAVVNGTDSYPYIISGLTNDIMYYFAVTAATTTGAESKYSNEVSATPKDTQGPEMPYVDGFWGGDNQVIIDWHDQSNGMAKSFILYYADNSSLNWGQSLNVAYAAKGTLTVKNLSNFTLYKFGLVAVDESNNQGSINVFTVMPMTAPTSFSAAGGEDEVNLSWKAPASENNDNITGYKIYYGSDSANLDNSATITGAANTAKTIAGLTGGVKYYFSIAPFKTNEGVRSSAVSATPFSAPSDLRIADASTESISLAWTAGAGAQSYKVYYGESASALDQTYESQIAGSSGKPVVINNLRTKTTYYFQVRSVSNGQESKASNQVYDATR